jgi:aminopeptidase N
VFVNGSADTFLHADHLLKIPASIAPYQAFEVTVYYHGTPTGAFYKGIHRQYSTEYDQWVTWTFSQPFFAYKWFPCKQMHEDKIDSVYMILSTDTSLVAVSSGTLYEITQLGNGKVMYEWRTKYAINYDLIFFAVSDYMLYDYYSHPADNDDSIHITNYLYNQDYLDDHRQRLDSLGLFVEYFSEIFGPYPFADECFGLVVVPGVPSMVENNTLVTMIDPLELGTTHTFIDGNCHELTHQWFGDFVACQTFADIWLSEGFGMYGGYLGEEKFGLPGSAEAWLEKTRNDALTPACGSVCVPENQLSNPSRIFDWQLSYCKGSMLLHMIRYILQDDALFFSILRNYIDAHGNGTAILEDFKAVLEEASGLDFKTFFDQWYYGEGHPLLDIMWESSVNTVHIYSKEHTTCDITPFFEFTMDYKIIFDNGDTVIRLVQDDPIEHFTIPVEHQVIDIVPDPEHWILAETNVQNMGDEEQTINHDLALYPNPCSGNLYVGWKKKDANVKLVSVYNASGKLVKQAGFMYETCLELYGLPDGIYCVIVHNDDQKITRKIILKQTTGKKS